MKFSYFSGIGYVPKEKPPTVWPLPPQFHVQENLLAGLERVFDMFQLADDLGFDWLSTPEHHFTHYIFSNPLLAAAVMSQRNYKAKIAVLGSIVPGRDPVQLAEDIATLDQLTQGQVVIGLLRGNPIEQIGSGINPQERRARFEEALELMLAAWEEPQPFGWEGRYYRHATVGVWPRPFNGKRPDILVPVSHPSGAELAARLRLSIGLGHLPVDTAARLADDYRRAAAIHGWNPTEDNIVYHCELYVSSSDAQAEDEVRTYRLGILPDPLGADSAGGRRLRAALGEREEDHFADGFRVLRFSGGPDTVAAQIAEAQKRIGFGVLNTIFQGGRLPRPIGLESVTLFGKEVMPRLR